MNLMNEKRENKTGIRSRWEGTCASHLCPYQEPLGRYLCKPSLPLSGAVGKVPVQAISALVVVKIILNLDLGLESSWLEKLSVNRRKIFAVLAKAGIPL
jgi:hypothetical protein